MYLREQVTEALRQEFSFVDRPLAVQNTVITGAGFATHYQ
jgi:hypothetical protein